MAKTLWGGFCDDKLDMRDIDDHFGGQNTHAAPSIFTSRKEARRQYEDVRKIKITPVR